MKIRDLPTKPLQDEALKFLCLIKCWDSLDFEMGIDFEDDEFWQLVIAEEFEEAKKLRHELWPTSTIRRRTDKPHLCVIENIDKFYLWTNHRWFEAAQSLKDYCLSVNPADMGYPTPGAAARALHYGSEA